MAQNFWAGLISGAAKGFGEAGERNWQKKLSDEAFQRQLDYLNRQGEVGLENEKKKQAWADERMNRIMGTPDEQLTPYEQEIKKQYGRESQMSDLDYQIKQAQLDAYKHPKPERMEPNRFAQESVSAFLYGKEGAPPTGVGIADAFSQVRDAKDAQVVLQSIRSAKMQAESLKYGASAQELRALDQQIMGFTKMENDLMEKFGIGQIEQTPSAPFIDPTSRAASAIQMGKPAFSAAAKGAFPPYRFYEKASPWLFGARPKK